MSKLCFGWGQFRIFAPGHQVVTLRPLLKFACRRGSTLGQGAIAPNLCLVPQMCHETLFDELKASAYRCKKKRAMAFKLCQNVFPVGALPRTPPASSRRSPDARHSTPRYVWGGAFAPNIFL